MNDIKNSRFKSYIEDSSLEVYKRCKVITYRNNLVISDKNNNYNPFRTYRWVTNTRRNYWMVRFDFM